MGDCTSVLSCGRNACFAVIQLVISCQTDTLSLDEGAPESSLLRLGTEAGRRSITAADRGLVQA